MSALWVAKGPIFLQLDNKDSDQTLQAHLNLYCMHIPTCTWIPALTGEQKSCLGGGGGKILNHFEQYSKTCLKRPLKNIKF